jgi:carboxyl-terminal processing protease
MVKKEINAEETRTMTKQTTKKNVILIFIMVITVTFTGIFVGKWMISSVDAIEGYEELKIFTEALSIVRKNYVEDTQPKELVYDAISGMIGSLDPHSTFMTPEQYKDMQVDTKGEFGGLGIQIGIKEGMLTVIAPIEDTPAYRAGIKAGDKIIKINDEFTKDMSLEDAVTKMRGTPSTSVNITVLRKGWKETKDFTIIREIIKIQSVKSKMLDDNIGYLKINQFQEKTATDLSRALSDLRDEQMNALILDLRNNPGGLLHSAVDVSSFFIPSGKLIVYIKDKNGEKVEYTSDNRQEVLTFPMIVIVNEGSASASEIVAGALKDWNKAVIIGTQTFGKGSVQSVIPLDDGSALRLTTAIYYTPNGTSIQTMGITPDIVVQPEVKEGEQLRPVIREKDLEGHLKNGDIDIESKGIKEMVPMTVEKEQEEDIQLQRAIDLLKTWEVFKQLPAAS